MVQGLQTKAGDFGVPAPESPCLPFSGRQQAVQKAVGFGGSAAVSVALKKGRSGLTAW
jgi:hypothetical protein